MKSKARPRLCAGGGWVPASVPGTALGALVASGQLPDPYLGLNNDLVPDVFHAGRGAYTLAWCNTFPTPQVHAAAAGWGTGGFGVGRPCWGCWAGRPSTHPSSSGDPRMGGGSPLAGRPAAWQPALAEAPPPAAPARRCRRSGAPPRATGRRCTCKASTTAPAWRSTAPSWRCRRWAGPAGRPCRQPAAAKGPPAARPAVRLAARLTAPAAPCARSLQPRGMFLRRRLDVTRLLLCQPGADLAQQAQQPQQRKTAAPLPENRLAVTVYPPDSVGCVDAGGQGGDHMIARCAPGTLPALPCAALRRALLCSEAASPGAPCGGLTPPAPCWACTQGRDCPVRGGLGLGAAGARPQHRHLGQGAPPGAGPSLRGAPSASRGRPGPWAAAGCRYAVDLMYGLAVGSMLQTCH